MAPSYPSVVSPLVFVALKRAPASGVGERGLRVVTQHDAIAVIWIRREVDEPSVKDCALENGRDHAVCVAGVISLPVCRIGEFTLRVITQNYPAAIGLDAIDCRHEINVAAIVNPSGVAFGRQAAGVAGIIGMPA